MAQQRSLHLSNSPVPIASASSETDPEAGFLLLGAIVLIALVLIALAVAAPIVAKDIRRDKEVESEHRAQQYVRGVRLYYRKFNTYPPSLDALKQSNNIRFLRKEYVDPLTGKSDWRILHLGEQKTTVKVFFGQELGAMGASGGMGSGLGSAAGMSSGIGTPLGGGSSTSTIGATSALASGFGGASITTGTGTGAGTTGAFGASGATGASGLSGSSGSSGSTGGAIIGVGTAKTGSSIATPNKQTTYETWEFWYDPRIELLYKKGQMNAGMSSGSLGSQPASSFGAGGASGATGGFGLGTPFSGPGASTGSTSSGSGTTSPSPAPPATSTPPPQ